MHLFVVGPPGIGKSTVAPLLAGMLGASVVETDRAIARRARKSNKDLIEQDGMEAFRDVESRVIASLQAVTCQHDDVTCRTSNLDKHKPERIWG